MISDFTVQVQYVNKDTGASANQVYEFNEFAAHHAYQLKRIIDDVEIAFSKLEGTTDKQQWRDSTREAFARFRQKQLNSANAIDRLPRTLCYQGVPCSNIKASEMLAAIIDHQ